MNVFRNFGSSRFEIIRTTDAGAQPPGFTVDNVQRRVYKSLHKYNGFKETALDKTSRHVTHTTKASFILRNGFYSGCLNQNNLFGGLGFGVSVNSFRDSFSGLQRYSILMTAGTVKKSFILILRRIT